MLEALRKSEIKVKPSKCQLHQRETEYLGFIIGQEGVKTDPVKTQAIGEWRTPKKIKEIRSSLGFCNFYQPFIEGFSRTGRPLYARTKKQCIGDWEGGDKEQKASDELRTKLNIAPLLVYFDPLARTDRIRHLKIYLLRHTITTMPGGEMETGGIPIQDHVECRMAL